MHERHRVGDPALSDIKDHSFGLVDCLLDIYGLGVANLGNFMGSGDQRAQNRVFVHDPGVVGCIGSRWCASGQ